ncbi:glycerol-3-phosphate dehydrogenase [cf. Phormidesmis sp. LEGE 11477]|uniref:glycerol-3-phosphate dehydrogenase n=1 Tax=cf. Phormidesmis sp. LEGE 11477 TaxID=1828680 RepID=UPI0018818957|nr:glycerol-3-phosphate dehydrogenase [cf. Phormidesmis sp. LEGE 11477]MBE9061670.1 glycerol-3-phosphate dehydrogenase [cf. Phormidesmis sp. LEGE 11477]
MPSQTSSTTRDFSVTESTTYDVIVIGGGINGAATARDAALRGLKTIIIDKGDFASGTTSWSSRLVHGGLRYLEYFEFNLVRESLAEREILLRSAPHLVHPLQLTIPIYDKGSRSYWEIWAGMILYDILSFDKSLLNHRMLPKAKLKQLFREVNPKGVQGAGQYYDAQVEYAERLCLENILSAQEAGATAFNYVKVIQLVRQGDRVTELVCKDEFSESTFTIKTHDKSVIVNTSGPWVDKVCDKGTQNEAPAPIGTTQKIGGTKGSHIVVDDFPGAPGAAFYVEALTDNRPFFILPFLGQYLIGTTDLRFSGDLDRVKADDDEIDYLIAETNKVFPAARLSRESVKFTYSGVRPLPYTESKKPGAVSRNHLLYDHAKDGVVNMVSLIGGKLTTHRRVGEEMVTWVYKQRQQSAPPCKTRVNPLPGAILRTDQRIVEAIAKYAPLLATTVVDHIFQRYGARALDLLTLVDESPELAEPIVAGLPDIKAQIVYAVRSEMALTFGDICRRRTMLSLQANYGMGALDAIAQTLQTYCQWSEQDCEQAIANYKTLMAENCIPDYAIEKVLGAKPQTNSTRPASEVVSQVAVG